jgi:hypothetical protein
MWRLCGDYVETIPVVHIPMLWAAVKYSGPMVAAGSTNILDRSHRHSDDPNAEHFDATNLVRAAACSECGGSDKRRNEALEQWKRRREFLLTEFRRPLTRLCYLHTIITSTPHP